MIIHQFARNSVIRIDDFALVQELVHFRALQVDYHHFSDKQVTKVVDDAALYF
jgi:hypothetical protein